MLNHHVTWRDLQPGNQGRRWYSTTWDLVCMLEKLGENDTRKICARCSMIPKQFSKANPLLSLSQGDLRVPLSDRTCNSSIILLHISLFSRSTVTAALSPPPQDHYAYMSASQTRRVPQRDSRQGENAAPSPAPRNDLCHPRSGPLSAVSPSSPPLQPPRLIN